MIGSVKLTNNADPDKYNYSGYGKGFDFCSEFSFKDGSVRKNVIIFGAGMSSPVQINDKDINILILDKGPTEGLDDTTLKAEAKYPINFTKHTEKELY